MPVMDQWTIRVDCGTHNHPAAEHLEGHSFAGRLLQSEKQLLSDMSKAGVKPKNVLWAIKEKNVRNVTSIKTIYNARARMRMDERGRRSEMQQLMLKLANEQYVSYHHSEEDDMDRVTDLFWAHSESIRLTNYFPYVFLMDCTYKTNRYKMPLLKIVRVTSTDKTFSISFTYMRAELEENFIWALECLSSVLDGKSLPSIIVTDRELALMNAIKRVFPKSRNLLCRWHISKNVFTKCRLQFKNVKIWKRFVDKWSKIVESPTKDQYEERLQTFEEEFSKDNLDAVNYVRKNWLTPFRQSFVAAWTDESFHFGCTTTNRVESAHARLKRELRSSQSAFATSWEAINLLIKDQQTEVKASLQFSHMKLMHECRSQLYKELTHFISLSALKLIHEDVKHVDLVGHDANKCGCSLRRTHGLPCAHETAQYRFEGLKIPLSSIHQHWKTISVFSAVKNMHDYDCHAEIVQILMRYENSNEDVKMSMKRKLRELAMPELISLEEPAVKLSNRGRPKGGKARKLLNLEKSTKRNPSAFEYTDLQLQKTSSQTEEPSCGPMNVEKLKVHRTQSLNPLKYREHLPKGFRTYVSKIFDVPGDGICGFRAIAVNLGMNSENGWRQVRKDMMKELLDNRSQYSKLYGCDEHADELIEILDYFEKDCVPHCHWMVMPEMGHIIASRYNVALIHISSVQCLAFVPLNQPPHSGRFQEIAIAFVMGNHFVRLILKTGCPIPSITKLWKKNRYEIAESWEVLLSHRTENFGAIVGTKLALREGLIEIG